jgi:hypothetical protein
LLGCMLAHKTVGLVTTLGKKNGKTKPSDILHAH